MLFSATNKASRALRTKLAISCLQKRDLRTNEQNPSLFFLLLAVFYGACSSQQEKTPQTDAEHGQTGQKLKY